jgi:predicted CopG family antitoxin
MIKRENVRIAVTISRQMYERLKEEAEYEGRSVSNLAAWLIKQYLKRKGKIDTDVE